MMYEGAVNTPIFQSSTFAFPTSDPRTWEGEVPEGSYIYSRYSNPTVEVVERKAASLEGAEAGMAFSSGMAAISSTLLAFLSMGDRLVSMKDLYGGTYALMRTELPRFGIDVDYVSTTKAEELIERIDANTKVVYLESPTNPLLKMIDIAEVCKGAKEKGCKVMIDNTFATPIFQRPIELGVDIVLHSCSKYLNGHSDVIAGLAIGGKEDMEAVRLRRKLLGAVLDPLPAFLLDRGMKTLEVRMRRHESNAMAIAEFLEDHSMVSKVLYPGLESHPDHALAMRQMDGFGGMITFEVKKGRQSTEAALKRFEVISTAASLGGVESLASMPLNTSHRAYSSEERERLGITDGMIRLSVGLEDVEDLKADLDAALR